MVESVEEQIKSKETQIINNKVSNIDNYNNELTSDTNEVIKNVVLESKVVSIASVNENERECDERLGGCLLYTSTSS